MSKSSPKIVDWVIDTDTHISEPGDLWTSRLPARFKDSAPRIVRDRETGAEISETIALAGKVRFRPILLTSLTTFAGLTPLLLEKSLQAKFLVPMAVSLGFGVIFATVITLILVPAMYLILEDIRTFFYGPEDKL